MKNGREKMRDFKRLRKQRRKKSDLLQLKTENERQKKVIRKIKNITESILLQRDKI